MNDCQLDFTALMYDLKYLKKIKLNPKDKIILDSLLVHLDDFIRDMEPYVPKD